MMPAMLGGGTRYRILLRLRRALPTFVISGLVIVRIGAAGLFSRRMVALGISQP